MECIESARVPIIKMSLAGDIDIHCDISLNKHTAIAAANNVKAWTTQFECFHLREWTLLVKYWVRARNLPDASQGGLSSYAWVLLVFFCLQQQLLSNKHQLQQFAEQRYQRPHILTSFLVFISCVLILLHSTQSVTESGVPRIMFGHLL